MNCRDIHTFWYLSLKSHEAFPPILIDLFSWDLERICDDNRLGIISFGLYLIFPINEWPVVWASHWLLNYSLLQRLSLRRNAKWFHGGKAKIIAHCISDKNVFLHLSRFLCLYLIIFRLFTSMLATERFFVLVKYSSE